MILLNYWTLQQNDDYIEVINNIAVQVQKLMLSELVPFLVAISILVSMTKYAIDKKKVGMEAKEAIRLIVVTFLLLSYNGWIKALDSIIDGVSVSFEERMDNDDGYEEMAKMKNLMTLQQKYPILDDELSGELLPLLKGDSFDNEVTRDFLASKGLIDDSLGATLLSYGEDVFTLINKVGFMFGLGGMAAALDIALKIVEIIYNALIFGFVAVMKAIGPLAIGMSILFPSSLKKWFMAYVMARFTVLSCAIISALNHGATRVLIQEIFEVFGPASGLVDMPGLWISYSGIIITNIILYLMCFYVTSKYIGDESTGAFLSTAGAIATAGVNYGVTAMNKAKDGLKG
ncbi:MAG: hypothetical protein ABJH98_17815 [Reichenbachiella sp.]|uniref:hypothetical protein n=1 Tax=Reichenbachiella sp. TaxID=2184521 RepID=UPI003267746A